MVLQERNQMILELHERCPDWSYAKIAGLMGISRQRVQQIVKCSNRYDIISDNMSNKIKINEPISLTQASRLTGIPTSVIGMWVTRGHVKIHQKSERPRACTGHPVLLDPVTLQERINRYRPRRRKE